MCPSPPLDASVPTARAKRYDLVAGCYPANATQVPGLEKVQGLSCHYFLGQAVPFRCGPEEK